MHQYNLGFSIFPKNTLACRLKEPEITPTTFRLVEDLLYLRTTFMAGLLPWKWSWDLLTQPVVTWLVRAPVTTLVDILTDVTITSHMVTAWDNGSQDKLHCDNLTRGSGTAHQHSELKKAFGWEMKHLHEHIKSPAALSSSTTDWLDPDDWECW